MIKAFSGRDITNVTVQLGKATVTVAGRDYILGTLTDTVFSFADSGYNRHHITSNGKIGCINPLDMESDKNSWL